LIDTRSPLSHQSPEIAVEAKLVPKIPIEPHTHTENVFDVLVEPKQSDKEFTVTWGPREDEEVKKEAEATENKVVHT